MDQSRPKSQPSVSELRRERERAEMTERIMNVAREMFVRDGYEAVTLRKIAQKIEYSPGFIYQFFQDKQALVMEIIRKDSDDLRAFLLECAEVGDPLQRVIEMARRYASWGIAHPNHYRLLLVPPPAWAEQDIELRKYERPPLERETLHVLTTLMAESIREGRLKEKYTDPGLVAATLWAGIHGAILLEITMTPKDRALLGVEQAPFETRFQTLVEVFLEGFYKHPPR